MDKNATVEVYNPAQLIKIIVGDKWVNHYYTYRAPKRRRWLPDVQEGIILSIPGLPGSKFFTLDEFKKANLEGKLEHAPDGKVIIGKDYTIYNLPYVKAEFVDYKKFIQYFDTFAEAIGYASRIEPEGAIKILKGDGGNL